MKKKLVVALLLGFSFVGKAQELSNWQVGMNATPSIFNRLNTSGDYKKGKQDFPNGFAFGVTIEKNWNLHWGLKTGVEYSKQNEKYTSTFADYPYNLKEDIKYFKIPLTIQYSKSLKNNLFLTFNQGFQISLLNHYKLLEENEIALLIHTDDYYHIETYPTFGGNQINATYDVSNLLFKKEIFGLIGSIGLKGFISKDISYSTNLRYEYDLTTSDEDGNHYFSNNNNSKNFRLGLELGLQYHFSLAGCKTCEGQKHNNK